MMKRIMHAAGWLSALLLIAGGPLTAQNKQAAPKDKQSSRSKLGEYDEIIIRKKTDKDLNSKLTIEIKDGKVTVNGKPVDDFSNNDLSIRVQRMPRVVIGRPSPFRSGTGSTWNFNGNRLFSESNRAFLGVSTQKADGGAKILSVTDGSAAEKAGLKEGDVITGVDDKKIENPQDLSAAIGKYKPEDKVTVTYKRDGKEKKASATLGENRSMSYSFTMPRGQLAPGLNNLPGMQEFEWRGNGQGPFIVMGRPRLGIRAQDTEDGKGVKVLNVMDESAADKAGLKEGDIITEFDGKTVNSVDELADAARTSRDKTSVSVKLLRDGKSMSLEIKTPKRLKSANL